MEGYNQSREPLSVREEFRWERFGLHYDSHINFLRSQWQSKPKSLFFLAYRCLLCAFLGFGVVTYTTVYHCQKKSWVPPSWVIKVYWSCFWITLCIECLVALSYWTLIYPRDRVRTNPLYVSGLYNIWTHALAPIVFTVDHFVVAQPARLLHFVYPVGFCLIYFGFTIIFYLAGGVNLNGRPYIYSFLKYSKPAKAVIFATLLVFLLVACSIFQYGVYRFRTYLARKFGKLILSTG